MKRVLLASFITAALTGAHAETLRLPETGNPAFVVTTPEGWTHTVNSAGNLIVFNEPHTASINFKIGELDGSLDELAVKAASTPDGMPPANRGAADIGAFHGTAYDSKLVTASGVKTDLHMILVKLDDGGFLDGGHFAAAILLTAEGIKDDQRAAARAVLAGVTLTTLSVAEPAPPAPAAAPAPPADAAPAKPDAMPAPKP